MKRGLSDGWFHVGPVKSGVERHLILGVWRAFLLQKFKLLPGLLLSNPE